MLKINKELFQWEKNRYVYVDESLNLSYLEFYNSKSKIGLESPIEDGKAKIPNLLLKQNLPIVTLGCIKIKGETQVLCRREFRVIPRAKPESYIDEDTYLDVIYDGGEEI